MAKASANRVVVSLDDASINDPAKWREAVSALRKHGLDVSRELNVVGVVAGKISPEKRPLLAKIPHVVNVSDDEERSVQ